MDEQLSEIESKLWELRKRKPFAPFAMKFKNGEVFKVGYALQFGFVAGQNRGLFYHPKRGFLDFRPDDIDKLQISAKRKR